MTKLRLELFVRNASRSAAFYCRVLSFTQMVERLERNAARYIVVQREDVRIALVSLAYFHRFLRLGPLTYARLPPVGTEIILEVEDLEATYRQVVASGYRLWAPMREQPWGSRDFRLCDPDGYYIRITTPS